MSTNNLKEQAHVEKLFFSALGSKLLLSAILLPLIILCLHGGTPDKGPSKTPPINREMSGAGKIATSAIHMVIHVEGNNITGYYFYDKYRVPISLTGQLEKDNRFTITETNDKGTITGYFTGTTTTFSRLEGRWLGPGKKKFLPFRVDCSEHFESHTIDKKNKYSELEIQYVRLCNFDDFSEQEKLNRKLRETFFQDWGTVGEIPELITKKDIEKYPDAYQYLPYRLGIRYKIDYFSYPVLLSMAIHKSGFTGGAHGWNNSHTINYDFRTHKEITLEDLFFDPVRGIKTVSEYCKTEIMEECEESDNVDHLFMTKFDYKSQDFGDLFTVSDTGLEMYFQDVLPHSLGSHRYVTVPWELLHPYLKPGFLPFLN